MKLASYLAFLSIFIFLGSQSLRAEEEERIAQVEVEAAFKVNAAIGLLISKAGTIQKPIINTRKAPWGGSMLVTFKYNLSEIQPDTMASAMFVEESTGGIIFAHLRPLYKDEVKNTYLDIPGCPAEKAPNYVRADSYGMLQSLIDVRTNRRDLSRQQMQTELNGEFLQELNQYEVALGLSRVKPISATIHPVELIDRLQRLSVALRQNASRPKQESEESEPSATAEKAE